MSLTVTRRITPPVLAQVRRCARFAPVVLVLVISASLLAAVHRRPSRQVPPSAALPAPIPAVRTTAPATLHADRFPDAGFTLRGVVMNAGRTVALISLDGRPEEPYRSGQEITSGVVVGAIRADRVDLKYGGSVKVLRLRDAARGPPVTDPLAERPGQIDNPILDPDSLTDDADLSTDNLLRDVTVTPNYAGGFMIEGVNPGSIYDKLGVRPGDVVYSLDPLRIAKLEELEQSSAIYQSEGARLEVLRDNRRIVLTYRFPAQDKSR